MGGSFAGKRAALVVCVFALGGLGAFACGLDESGLEGGDAGIDVIVGSDAAALPDVSTVDVSLPPTCASTDVSCLGFDAGLPDGWSAFVIEVDGGACPSTEFAATAWQTNPRLANGACACACNPSGAWTCPSMMGLANGGGCGTTFTVDAGGCNTQMPPSSHLELPSAPTALGNVTCVADASAPAATTDGITLCAAGCDAGVAAVCGQPAGRRCIAADGIQPCPSTTFTQHIVGAGAAASCSACACKPSAPPTCAATAHVYSGYFSQGYHVNNDCSTGGQWQSQTLVPDTSCQAASFNYESFDVEWNALPAASCTPAGGGGDAGLTSPKTLCCN